MSDVVAVTGAGQISLAIVRRVGFGKKIIIGDKQKENAESMSTLLNQVGFDCTALELDISSKESILSFLSNVETVGDMVHFINGAGVSPSQATVNEILKTDLVGTAILLEEVGKRIKKGGTGVTISSQSSYRMPALGEELNKQLACTPSENLLEIEALKSENITDSLHAYQLAKRGNEKRVMAEAIKWGKRQARINSISPGIIVTPLAIDEFNGERGDFYRKMFEKSPAKRPGTADEVANVAELLLSEKGTFISGSDFLVDGGATAAFFYADEIIE